MAEKLTYKGTLGMGLSEKIRLATKTGKRGYKISKFQIISTTPGVTHGEFVVCIYKKPTSAGTTVDFSNDSLIAVAYTENINAGSSLITHANTVIFDQEIFNQDIFVTADDAGGGTVPVNYYIELETVSLSDSQATQLTLRNLRDIYSGTF